MDLLEEALSYKNHDTHGDEAANLLRRYAIQSVHRAPVQNTDVYEDYRVRYSRMPALEGIVSPGADAGNGRFVPDFELHLGETVLPFSAASMVTVSRSNQNAAARASIRSDGYEIVLLKLFIPEVFEAP